MTYDMIYI